MDVKLLKKIAEGQPRKRPKDFGITAREYAKANGISVGCARRILDELMEAGILKREAMLDGKGKPFVYYEPTPNNKKAPN